MFRWETDKVGPSLGTLRCEKHICQICFSVHLRSSHYTKVKARTAATMAEFAMSLGAPRLQTTLNVSLQEMLGEQERDDMFSDQLGSKQYVAVVLSRTLVAAKATKSTIPKKESHWMQLAIRAIPCCWTGLQFPESRASHASHALFGQPQWCGAPGVSLIMAARLGGPPGTSATKRSFRMSHHFAICSRCVP